jgi:hypothetical protein
MSRTRPRTKTSRPTPPSSPAAAPPVEIARFSWLDAAIVLALAALVVALYAQVRHFGFVELDDPVQVVENADVAAGLTWHGVAWAFTAMRAGYWMPLIWISHMADVQIYGMNAGGHHVTNLILHAINTGLLFVVLLRLTGARWPSAVVAALFAVHPLHVESVAWITERKDVLSTVFWLLTMLAYERYVRVPTRTRYGVAIAAFALGLLTKPMLVTLPLVLLMLDAWPLRRPDALRGRWIPLIREKLPFFALAAVGSVIAFVAQDQAGAVASLDTAPLTDRLSNAAISYVGYLGKMIWPSGLSVFYALQTSFPVWKVAGALALLTAISYVAWRAYPKRPYLLVGWLWYVVTLLPVIGIVQIGLQGMADRFTYVPLIGVFIAIVWLVWDLVSTQQALRAAAVVACAAIAGCAAVTRHQLPFWRSNVTLFTRATIFTLGVDEFQAHMDLGAQLQQAGRLDEAAEHFGDAIVLKPDSVEAHTSLGLLLVREDKPQESLAHFAAVVRAQPNVAAWHVNYAAALMKAGKPADAKAELDAALRLDPTNAQARAALAQLGGGK